jgi:hypothetical protein
MTLTLAPSSQRAFVKCWLPTEHAIVGHPGSFLFSRRGSSITALHSSVSYTTSGVGKVLLFQRISVIYLAYVGTCIASRSGMLTYGFLTTRRTCRIVRQPPASLSVLEMVRQLYRDTPVKFWGFHGCFLGNTCVGLLGLLLFFVFSGGIAGGYDLPPRSCIFRKRWLLGGLTSPRSYRTNIFLRGNFRLSR